MEIINKGVDSATYSVEATSGEAKITAMVFKRNATIESINQGQMTINESQVANFDKYGNGANLSVNFFNTDDRASVLALIEEFIDSVNQATL